MHTRDKKRPQRLHFLCDPSSEMWLIHRCSFLSAGPHSLHRVSRPIKSLFNTSPIGISIWNSAYVTLVCNNCASILTPRSQCSPLSHLGDHNSSGLN